MLVLVDAGFTAKQVLYVFTNNLLSTALLRKLIMNFCELCEGYALR